MLFEFLLAAFVNGIIEGKKNNEKGITKKKTPDKPKRQ